jgi:acetyl esterase/lipase
MVIFGPEKQRPQTQPINHIDGKQPPLMLIVGDRDEAIDPPEDKQVAAKVKEKGGEIVVVHYPTLDHGGTVEALSGKATEPSQVMKDIVQFIKAHSEKPL